jgi:hypothetical protein
MGAVLATGVLAGILVAWPRISPLAAGLPGLAALAWTVVYAVSVKQAVGLIPLKGHAFGAGWEALLFNGILGFAGLAMIIPMCLPARWRNPYAQEDAAVEAEVSDAQEYVAGLKATAGPGSADSPRRSAAGPVSGRQAAAPGVLTGRPIPPGAQRTTGGQHRLTAEQQRMAGGQPRVTGGQHRSTGGQPVVPGGQRVSGAQQRVTGSQLRVTGTQSRPTGSQPTMTGAQLSAQLRMSGAQRRMTGGQGLLREQPADWEYPGASDGTT